MEIAQLRMQGMWRHEAVLRLEDAVKRGDGHAMKRYCEAVSQSRKGHCAQSLAAAFQFYYAKREGLSEADSQHLHSLIQRFEGMRSQQQPLRAALLRVLKRIPEEMMHELIQSPNPSQLNTPSHGLQSVLLTRAVSLDPRSHGWKRALFNTHARPILQNKLTMQSVHTLNAIVEAAANSNSRRLMRKAFNLFSSDSSLHPNHASPNMRTFTILSQAYARPISPSESETSLSNLEHIVTLAQSHSSSTAPPPASPAYKKHVLDSIILKSILLDAYGRRGMATEMMATFAELRKLAAIPIPTSESRKTRDGSIEAVPIFNRLDHVVYNSLLSGLGRAKDTVRMREVYSLLMRELQKGRVAPCLSIAIKRGRDKTPSTDNLIDQESTTTTAPSSFKNTTRKQLVITYSTMIEGFMKAGDLGGVAWVYREMRDRWQGILRQEDVSLVHRVLSKEAKQANVLEVGEMARGDEKSGGKSDVKQWMDAPVSGVMQHVEALPTPQLESLSMSLTFAVRATPWRCTNAPRLARALSTTLDKEHLAPASNKLSSSPVPHLKVIHSTTGEYTSSLISTRHFKPGQVIASFADTLSLAPTKRYSTVQVSKHAHIELNSDLVYMNHSCDPAAVVDVEFNVVAAAKEITPGEAVTFFYPSTEWEMDQPFQCWCGSPKCLKVVKGAKGMHKTELDQFAISKHILELAAERDSVIPKQAAETIGLKP
ncbi:hypothetical protein HDU81_009457 [Chytriomyces hyalinus]|nr:hypothetical protein HDU81_009457 [Chytriomyces hyalinus]